MMKIVVVVVFSFSRWGITANVSVRRMAHVLGERARGVHSSPSVHIPLKETAHTRSGSVSAK